MTSKSSPHLAGLSDPEPENTMDHVGKPLRILNTEGHSVRKLKLHDLVEQDFDEVDPKRIEEFTRVLRDESVLGGDTELPGIYMIEKDGQQVASGNMASIQAAKIRNQWFACKTIWIPVKDNREMYDKEIECLQKLRKAAHWHVIQLIGSYIDPSNEGHMILSPLADCDLASFLAEPLTVGRGEMMRSWFGCLAAALKNIHDHSIRHKDIKPENILVYGGNIIITDFGISNHFCGRSSSRGRCLGASVYMAPEVFEYDQRGRSQDVWSLICCFIEMVSVLQGHAVDEFRKWCNPEAWCFNFNKDHKSVVRWLTQLEDQTKPDDPLASLHPLILRGFKVSQEERLTATELLAELQDIPSLVGECCTKPVSRCGLPDGEQSVYLSGKVSRGPEAGPLSDFLISARKEIMEHLQEPSIPHILDHLLNEIDCQKVKSIRSAEKKLLFYIAPAHCSSTDEYLSFSKAFINHLATAVKCPKYTTCLYDESTGEQERVYTTVHFATLVDLVLSRCRTYRWPDNKHCESPSNDVFRPTTAFAAASIAAQTPVKSTKSLG